MSLEISMGPAEEGTIRVWLEGIEADCVLGVYEEERERVRPVRVDVALDVERPAEAGDELASTLNYEGVEALVLATAAGGKFRLVESLAEAVAARCLRFERVRRAGVRVSKPGALGRTASVGATAIRSRKAAADG